MINRDYYLHQISEVELNGFIKILVGVRRCGKSTLLLAFEEKLIGRGVKPEQIIKINFEDYDFDELKDGKKFHQYVLNKINDNKQYYLFIDEVQELNEWSRIINSIRVKRSNVDIYVTGSNGKVFIGDYLTYLAGRYISINIYPLSYHEYKLFTNNYNDVKTTYFDFSQGSFPSYVNTKFHSVKETIMTDLYNSIFIKDIIQRNQIRNETTFNNLTRYLYENIGKNMSTKKIADTLTTFGYKTESSTIDTYINGILKSFCLYHCLRYDIKSKEIFKTLGKYYSVDLGLRAHIIHKKDQDTGKIFENIVFLELLKKGYQVYTGKVGRDYEIDFIAIKEGKTLYIQVSESILNEDTRTREERPYLNIKDNNLRLIVTLDEIKFGSNFYEHMTFFEFVNFI